MGTPLANGASIDLRFPLGVQQTGNFRFAVIPEALPQGGNTIFAISGCTDCPTVTSIVRASPNPTPSGSSVNYTVTFSTSVTGVDATDFALTTTGSVAGASAGASVTGVTGSGATRTVTVSTGSGGGTLRLDVVDNDSIIDSSTSTSLGGTGAGNGSFTTGEVYTITAAPPTVTSIVRASANPTTSGTSVNYTVTFSTSVTGVDASDFALTITGALPGAAITGVTGSGATRTVTVFTGNGAGTLRLDVVDNDTIIDGSSVPLGGPGAGNGSFTSGEVYTVIASAAVPAIEPRYLLLLAVLLAMIAVAVTRQL